MGKVKEYYFYELLNNEADIFLGTEEEYNEFLLEQDDKNGEFDNKEHPMNNEMTQEEIDEAFEGLEKTINAYEDWGRDSDLSMPNGPHGDESFEKLEKSFQGEDMSRPKGLYGDEELQPQDYVGKVVSTIHGKGYIQEVRKDMQHGMYWIIKLDTPALRGNFTGGFYKDDIFRTQHPEEFEIINENLPPVIPDEKVMVNGTIIERKSPCEQWNDVYINNIPTLDGSDGGNKPKCECGIAAVYKDHHARMHDSKCPLSNKNNW